MGKSWNRLNQSMSSALSLAIESGHEFHLDDFKRFDDDFRSVYWIGADHEGVYSHACGGGHGPNMSAILAYEAWVGRKPWIVWNELEGKKVRLHAGVRMYWFDDPANPTPETMHTVRVNSFNDNDDYVNVASYKAGKNEYRESVDRMFKIRRDGVKAFHAAIKALKAKKVS